MQSSFACPGASGEVDIFCRPDGTAYVCGENDMIDTPDDPLDVKHDPAAIARLKVGPPVRILAVPFLCAKQ